MDPRVTEILARLERRGSARNRAGMARFGIVSPRVYGVPLTAVRALAKQCGRDHALALELWKTGWLEARLLAAFVAEPARLTSAQMDRWTRDFVIWALCDGLCLQLFDRTPWAWGKIRAWSRSKEEFTRRAAFALLAALASHDRTSPDARFARALGLVRKAAHDDRNYVRKAVSWALRGIGKRSRGLHRRAMALARELAASDDRSTRWIGKDALRDLSSDPTRRRLAAYAAGR